jgi:hypothetical protein
MQPSNTFRHALASACALAAGAAQADTSSLQGRFAVDDALAVYRFELSAPGDVSASTWSYGGGTLASGDAVPAGGFAPVLSLFDASGSLVQLDVGSSHSCAASFCWDASLQYGGALPGHYTLVLSQDGNTPLGNLADGFAQAGQPHYTAAYLGGAAPDALFIQVDGSQRSGLWAMDLALPAGVSPVPEPGPGSLLAAGLAVLVLLRRRQCRHDGPL